jgi:hypothetical protein
MCKIYARLNNTSLWRLTFACLWIGLILAPLVPAQAMTPATRYSAAPPESRFGIVEAYYRPGDARDLNVGWDRVIFEWPKFQPDSPDQFLTDAVPADILSEARLAGREVIGLLKNTPLWASGTTKLGAPPQGLDLPLDDPGNVWAAFVRRTVQYYGEQWGINHWIIYNEPDLRPGEIGWYEFDGTVEDYYRMLKVAYLAAKAVNPDAVIHLAGMAWWTDKTAGRDPYLQRLLTVIARDPDAADHHYYFDVVMVHVYFSTRNVWNMLVEIEGILWHFDLQNKAIWIDETNARPSQDPFVQLAPGLPYNITLEQQADFLVQAAALGLAAGVERFAVYRLYDDHFVPGVSEPWGLVRSDGSRRPAFATYRTIIETFSGTTDAQWLYSENASLVVLTQPGQTVYVLWVRKTLPVTFYISAFWPDEEATQISVTGAAQTVVSASTEHFKSAWFTISAPAAVLDSSGEVVVEGTPTILIASGDARLVSVEVEGKFWQLR